jgi:hypothetical protein
MPKLEIKVPHELTQSEALTRIQEFIPELKAQHADRISDIEDSWSGNTGTFKFTVSGFKVNGTLNVDSSAIIIKGSIPLIALPIKGKIVEVITTSITELLK